MFDQELDEFKSRIDLREYAAKMGYELDRHESSRCSSIMRDGKGDKLVIKRNPNGHFVYFSVRDDHDNGTIIDFLANRRRLTLGQIRKELRPWTGRKSPASLPLFTPLQPAAKDHAAVEREYSRMKLAGRHPYLERERRIPGALLGSPRFAGRIRVDDHGNAIFPHFDAGGLCGFEKKNRGFTGFATGGIKGLWESHDQPDDGRLIFAESAIDALSYAALFPDAAARYRSIGGQVNDQQPALIRTAVLGMPDGSEVIAAMDNDDAGQKLSSLVEKTVAEVGRPSLTFRRHLPEKPGADWNEILQHSFPIAQTPQAAPA
jgi:hypothetical protein